MPGASQPVRVGGELADEVAYNNHDVDDGLRSALHLLSGPGSADAAVPAATKTVLRAAGEAGGRRGCRAGLIHETIRGMINEVTDLVEISTGATCRSGDGGRACGRGRGP